MQDIRLTAEKEVHRIGQALQAPATNDLSLGQGAAGIALFYYRLYRYTADSRHLDQCHAYLEQIMEGIGGAALDHSMRQGLAGIAWTFDVLGACQAVELDADAFFGDLDNTLYIHSLRALMARHTGFLAGGLGAVLHATYRLPNERAQGYLQQVIGILNSYHITGSYIPGTPVNTAVGDGLGGTLALLLILYEKGFETERVSGLIKRCMDIILAVIADGDSPRALRWHDGILGLAGACWRAGYHFHQPTWQQAATGLIERTLSIALPQGNMPVSTDLYDGTAGIAQLYKRLQQYTAISECEARSTYWIDATLRNMPNATPGLLHGLAGTGLVLLDFLEQDDMPWNTCLLL